MSLGSLRAGYERESFGPRRAQMPSELECAQPETAIPYLAAAAVRWETWKPDDLSVQQCWDLRDEIEALQFALQDIQDGIETSLRSRDEES